MRRLLLIALVVASSAAACDDDGGPGPELGVDDLAAPGDLAAAADLADPCFDRGADAPPARLSCTGLYRDPAAKALSDGVRAYTPGVELWSDGATKQRWIALPAGAQIDTTNPDEWRFPVGTKVWKEFSIAGARIETRLFWKRGASDWVWTTYRWAADESDAARLDDGAKDVVGTYEIPTHDQCQVCHGGRTDKLLGFEQVSLGLPSARGLTLATLVGEGRLTVAPPSTSFALPEDSTGKAAAALGWLHANCGTACHNRNPSAGAYFTGMFLRLPAAAIAGGTATVTTLDSWTTTVGQPIGSATYDAYIQQGYQRIAAKMSAKSLIPTVAGTRDPAEQMPPLVTHAVPTDAVNAIRAWIDALP